jgi:polysaccharide pyruvyl transferase WcaK-like protein
MVNSAITRHAPSLHRPPTSRPTVCLHGSYRNVNFGDVLLLDLVRTMIHGDNATVDVVMPFPCKGVAAALPSMGVDPTSVFRADGLVFGGGGYFGEPATGGRAWALKFLARHAAVGLLGRTLRIPTAIVGVGAGPITDRIAKRAAVAIINHAQLVVVRDQESRDYLDSCGVSSGTIHVASDLALAITADSIGKEHLKWADTVLAGAGSSVLGVHFHYPSNFGELEEAAVEAVQRVVSRGPYTTLIIFADMPYAFETQRRVLALKELRNVDVRVVPYVDHHKLLALLSRLDLVVTSKLHVGIACAALGRPAIAIPFHPKTRRFYSQLCMEHRCIEGGTQGIIAERLDYAITEQDETWIAALQAARLGVAETRKQLSSFVAGLR